MYLKLAIRNAKRSICNYFLYITTMTVLMAVMSVSNHITITGRVEAGLQTSSLPVLIILISVILTGYINRFMLRQRAKEFGNYILMGMDKSRLSWMFFMEFLIIGLLCFGLGALIGSIFYAVLYSVLPLSLRGEGLRISLFLQSLLHTFLSFCIVECLTAFRIKRNMDRLQIRELLAEEKRCQTADGKKHGRFWGMLSGISLLSLAMLLLCITFFPSGDVLISVVSIPLLLSVFAFYQWFYLLLNGKRQSPSEPLYRRNRLYLIAQLTSQSRTAPKVDGIFCICLIFSTMSFATGAIMLQREIHLFDETDQQWMGLLQISLSIIFIVIYFSILSLHQMIEFKQQRKNMKLLNHLGETGKELSGLLKTEILIKLSMPAMAYAALLPVSVPLLNYKLNTVLPAAMRHLLLKSMGWFFSCFFILYLLYVIVIYAAGKRYMGSFAGREA